MIECLSARADKNLGSDCAESFTHAITQGSSIQLLLALLNNGISFLSFMMVSTMEFYSTHYCNTDSLLDKGGKAQLLSIVDCPLHDIEHKIDDYTL